MLKNSIKILLLILIACSKEFLVFNEEILVLISFSIFIYLVSSKAGSMITSELDTTALNIQNKFVIYKNIQEKTIIHLLNYHNKRGLLSEKLQLFFKIKKIYIVLLKQNYKLNLVKQITLQLEDTLNRFASNEESIRTQIQDSFLFYFDNLAKPTR